MSSAPISDLRHDAEQVTSSLSLSITSHLLIGKLPVPLAQSEASLNVYSFRIGTNLHKSKDSSHISTG